MIKTNNGSYGTSPFSKNRFCVSRIKMNHYYSGDFSISSSNFMLSNDIGLGSFNNFSLYIHFAAHETLPTTINLDIYWREIFLDEIYYTDRILLYSGITSIGQYTIPFGNNSGIHSDRCFIHGKFEFFANSDSNFFLNNVLIYQK